jgi:hypothetical protein
VISSTRVLGLAVIVIVGVALMGAVDPAPAAGRPGPNVVNIDSMAFSSHLEGGFVPIGTADPLVLYDVPRGFWLLVTDVELAGSFGVSLVEIDGHVLTTKRGPRFNSDPADPSGAGAYHSSVGLAFAPGSQVALQNVSGTQQAPAFTLTGHLTRE